MTGGSGARAAAGVGAGYANGVSGAGAAGGADAGGNQTRPGCGAGAGPGAGGPLFGKQIIPGFPAPGGTKNGPAGGAGPHGVACGKNE